MGSRKIDIAGQTFGRLTALHVSGSTADREIVWSFSCSCGGILEARSSHVRYGKIRSCGCLRRENSRAMPHDWGTKHGKSGSAEYRIWAGMRRRCSNPKDPAWLLYGGRGIRVCERWNDFAAFLADMGPRPSKRHSVDRYPNQDGNYEPGNCRWATQQEQSCNTRRNIIVDVGAGSEVFALACRRLGLNIHSVRIRMRRKGIGHEQAIKEMHRG